MWLSVRRFGGGGLALASVLTATSALAQQTQGAASDTPNSDTPNAVGAVVINAPLKPVKVLADRKVYDLARSPAYASSAISELLGDIPGLSVSVDGALQAVGGRGVAIYVDGKPAPQFEGAAGAAQLSQTRAQKYVRVELLTNPPASFAANIRGPVINLITRQMAAANTGVGVKVGLANDGGFEVSLSNDRLTSLGATSLSASTKQTRVNQTLSSDVVIGGAGEAATGARRMATTKGWNRSSQATASIKKSPREALTLSADLTLAETERSRQGRSAYTVNGRADRSYVADQRGQDTYKAGFASSSATYKSKRHNVSLNLSAAHHEGAERSRQYTRFGGAPSDVKDYLIYQDSDANSWGAQISDEFTASKAHTLQTGLEYRAKRERRVDGLEGEVAGEVEPYATRFSYREGTLALYATENYSRSRTEISVGARYEDYRVSPTYDGISTRNVASSGIYPSVNIAYHLAETQDLSLSYTEKVIRPSAGDLNATLSYDAPGYASIGNPSLRPSRVRTAELSYDAAPSFGQYGLSLRVERIGDDVVAIQRAGPDGLIISTSANSSNTRDFIASGYFKKNLTKRLSVSGDLSYSWRKYTPITADILDVRSGSSPEAKLTLDWRATDRQLLQIKAYLWGADKDTISRTAAYQVLNIGYRFKINQKTTLVVSANDIFGGSRYRERVYARSLYSDSLSKYDTRRVVVSIVKSFGAPRDRGSDKFEY